MKILKKIFFFLIGLIAVALVAAWFMPKAYTVSASETINRPKADIINYMKMLKNQEYYSVWVMEDPTNKVEYKGVDGSVGAIQAWNGEKSGQGEQEITKISDDRINVDLRFKKPFESNQKASTIFKSIDSTSTMVTSEFYGTDKWPMNALSFIGKNMIHDAELKNLKNLKAILEKK